MVLAASHDHFDRELATWFAQHGGPWSGTASELLAALKAAASSENNLPPASWPESSRALYTRIESQRQRLRSLGVDVLLHEGHPRMISVRSCPKGKPGRSHTPTKECATGAEVGSARAESLDRDIAAAKADAKPDLPANGFDVHEGSVNENIANGTSFEGGIFNSTREARFALVEMRVQIREQALPLESAIDLVVRRTQEITRCCGMAVALLREETVTYPARTGAATSMGALQFEANLFQSCFKSGRILQLCDAQNHLLVGALCQQEGIGSLILVPLFHQREVAGAVEFLFGEKRSFSISDVMDMELIAGIVSESLSNARQTESKPLEALELLPKPETITDIDSTAADSLIGKDSLEDGTREIPFPLGAFQSAILRQLALKRTWMKWVRAVRLRSSELS
ncbi:MAG: GAF domain-containing protein [Terriglobales bacterium]